MDSEKAKASYFRFRVQSLRDEASALIAELVRTEAQLIAKREMEAKELVATAERQVVKVIEESKAAVVMAETEAQAAKRQALASTAEAEAATRSARAARFDLQHKLEEQLNRGLADLRATSDSYRARWLALLFCVVISAGVAGLLMHFGLVRVLIGSH